MYTKGINNKSTKFTIKMLTDEVSNYIAKTELPPDQQKAVDKLADQLRMKFITEWVLKRNIDSFTTDAETDWAYVVRRDYRYCVNIRALCDGIFVGSFMQTLAIYKAKGMKYWPLLLIPLVYITRKPTLY